MLVYNPTSVRESLSWWHHEINHQADIERKIVARLKVTPLPGRE